MNQYFHQKVNQVACARSTVLGRSSSPIRRILYCSHASEQNLFVRGYHVISMSSQHDPEKQARGFSKISLLELSCYRVCRYDAGGVEQRPIYGTLIKPLDERSAF